MRALLVSSGNPRGLLAACRHVASAGWTVAVGTADLTGPASWTKATSSLHRVPKVQEDLEGFLAAVGEAVRATRSEVILPGGDAELMAVSERRGAIPAVVPLADEASVRRSVDKLELVRAGRRAGLAVPETEVASEGALAAARYPLVVKSRFHWLPGHVRDAPSRLEASVCHDVGAARSCAEQMRAAGATPLAQQHVEGPPVNVHVLTDQGGTTRAMVQQDGAPLLYPPGAGRRIRSITVPLEAELAAGIPALMRDLGWFGFAGLNFIRDPGGRPRLIDFNGRIPMTLEASAGAGANLLAAWLALATGREPPSLEASMGVRCHWLEGDLRRAVRERRGGLVRDLAGTLVYATRARHTFIQRDEPLLAVRFAAQQLRHSQPARRLAQRRRRASP